MDLYTSTPRPARDAQMFDSSDTSVFPTPAVSLKSSSITKDEAKAKKSSKILDLICEAIKEIGGTRKGASYNGIKKYVNEHDQNEKSAKLFLTLFKKSFVRGLEQKLFIRKDAQVTGFRGYFGLPKEPKVKAKKTPALSKQVAKPRPTKPVSNVVSLARKKKKMAIMNGSIILKRNSMLLNKVKKSTDSAKAKKVKNTKSEDALEKEPGTASAKGSKKEPKLLAEKQVKAASRGKKQTKTVASDINENRQVQKTKAVAKKTSKTVDPAKNQSKSTTKKQAEPKKPRAVYKAKILYKTEAPTRKQKTASSDETEVTKRKQMKTASSDETEVTKRKQMKSASSDEAEAPAKKHPKTKAPPKKNLKTKTPAQSKVFSFEVNDTSSDEAEAATDEQMKSASSDEAEAPAKKHPKTKAPPKKNLKTKTPAESKVFSKEVNDTSSDVAEAATDEQMKSASSNEAEAPAKKHPKTKAPPKKNLKTKTPAQSKVFSFEVNDTSSDEAEAATDEQIKSASSDETEVPIKKEPKSKAPPKNIKTKELSDMEVFAKEMMNTSSGEVEVSTIEQMKTVPPDESGPLAKRQQKTKAEKSPNGVPRKQMKTVIPDEDGNQQNVKVPAKKQPKGAAQASGSKKLPRNETFIEKQPKVVTEKEKKSKKKEVTKLIDKVKGRKNLRRDLSDSELDVSRRTKPLKSYHSDPEVMEN